MSRKNKTLAPVSVIDSETPETLETVSAPEVVAAPETLPAPPESLPAFRPLEKKAPGFGLVSERDFLGYTKGSYTSRIASLLATEEGATKAELLEKALDVSADSSPSVAKARKTTLSVFLSDSKRTPGTYPVSRSFLFEEDGSGKIRFTRETLSRAVSAIADGLLSDLGKAKTESARKVVLSRFGF